GQIALPWGLPPPALAALRLPQPSSAVRGTQILGALVLDMGADAATLAGPDAALRGVTLTSSSYASNAGAVGSVEVRFVDGGVIVYDVVQGRDTNSWQAADCSACRVALRWHKRLDKLGRSAYPAAWHDFTARAFATELRWGQSRRVAAIRLRSVHSATGQWWVWQVVPIER
ncbi:MAG: hypothetical protein H7Y32_04700, partial [Chloroflexales bacterium]|nr:hypothetical protein [Chloroflexales bacterium]